MLEHVRKVCEPGTCDGEVARPLCPFCVYWVCAVCGNAEAELEVECPGPGTMVFDLDLTLADSAWRASLAKEKRWDEFHAGIPRDPADPLVAFLLRAALGSGYRVALVTGRPEERRAATEDWLRRKAVPWHELRMRADGDYRPDVEVKREHLVAMRREGLRVVLVLDDRDRVVSMWREEGVPCWQVRPGAY